MSAPDPSYDHDALIRTFNSESCLPATLDALLAQEVPPRRIIVVDSGSTDRTCAIALAHGCVMVPYGEGEFGYSRALNLGFESVQARCCLVLSSHVTLDNRTITRRLLREVSRAATPAAYVNFLKSDDYREEVCLDSFTGWNGLWNPCSMYRTDVVRSIRFSEEVPTAEDQWFAKQLYLRGFRTVAIGSSGVRYSNRNLNRRKARNEHVAIACHVHPALMSTRSIIRVVAKAGVSALLGRLDLAQDRAILAARLFAARIRRPRFPARYF